jgi:FlaA1/EpsC-like NDP-sugar epimerase
LVLDMGEPVKILDVAARMIAMSGKEVDMVFTGLREGEKLHEELLGVGETDDRPLHPMVSHVTVPPMRPELIQAQDWTRAVMARHSCDSAIPLRALA